MKTICSLGRDVPYETYMQLINDVFGFTQSGNDFRTLLPKLYRPGRRPQDENYCVTEVYDDGTRRTVAAIGAFTHEIVVCGKTLKCRGIGNVAVSADKRSLGYMKAPMEMALDDMVKDGVVLSTLGGRRQRYNYFSYDRAGTCYTCSLNGDNMRHCFGKDRKPAFDTVTHLTAEGGAEPDAALLGAVRALSASGDFYPVRAEADFLDICETWHGELYAVSDKGRFVGYAILESGHSVTEIRTVRDEDFLPMLTTLFDAWARPEISIRLGEHMVPYVEALAPIAEGVQTGCSMMYSVLNYAAVCDAFLQLKATYTALPDGRLTLLIHGRGGDETVSLSVKDGVPSVETLPAGSPVDRELTHLEAMNLLFSPFAPARRTLPAAAKVWLPLPIWMYRADEV